MGWFTTSEGQNLRQKARQKAGDKVQDAKDAVNPKKVARKKIDKRHENKGGAFCDGCGKPIKGVKANQGNVHNKASCQRAAAKGYGSVMDRDW